MSSFSSLTGAALAKLITRGRLSRCVPEVPSQALGCSTAGVVLSFLRILTHLCQSDFLSFYSFLPYLLMSSPVSKFMHWLNISAPFRDCILWLWLRAGRNAAMNRGEGVQQEGACLFSILDSLP